MSWASKLLNGFRLQIRFKQGNKANINATLTKGRAITGEPHYAADTSELFIYNGTENRQIPVLSDAALTPWSGTFTNGDGATVTVDNGVIVDVS